MAQQKADKQANLDEKTALILRNSQKAKVDYIPEEVQYTFEKMKYLYPGFGFQTTDPNTMRYVEERTFEKNFFTVL